MPNWVHIKHTKKVLSGFMTKLIQMLEMLTILALGNSQHPQMVSTSSIGIL